MSQASNLHNYYSNPVVITQENNYLTNNIIILLGQDSFTYENTILTPPLSPPSKDPFPRPPARTCAFTTMSESLSIPVQKRVKGPSPCCFQCILTIIFYCPANIMINHKLNSFPYLNDWRYVQ